MFGPKKGGPGAPVPPGTSAGRLGTASRAAAAAAAQAPTSVMGAPPGSASKRLQTGAATAQRRPTTAIQGAGFTTGALGSAAASSGPTQFEKKEETYVNGTRK